MENGNRPRGGIKEIEEGIPSIGGEHLNADGGFDLENVKLIPRDFYRSLKRGKIKRQDVLVVKDGATTGKTSFVGMDFPYHESAVNEHVFILRGREELIDQKFLFYHMFSPLGQRQIKANFHGSAVGGINTQFVKKYSLLLPPIDAQKEIVSILDKAKQLRQWRKESDKLTNDYLHSVFLELFGSPVKNDRKWKTVTLKEISEFYSGKAWKNKELSDQGVKIVRISNLHKKNFPFWHYSGGMIEKYSVSDGDLLFSWAGVEKSIDVYIYDGEKALLNQHIYNIKIVNSEFPKLFVYWILRFFLRYLRLNLGGGVGQFHLKKSTIENIRIINPPPELKRKFISIVEATEKIRKKQIESGKQIDAWHNVLMQKAFRGELVC